MKSAGLKVPSVLLRLVTAIAFVVLALAPARAAEVLIAAAGDVACNPDAAKPAGECKDANTAQLIVNRKPIAVFALGDLQYPSGSLSDFQAGYGLTWGRFKGKTYPVPGNHEYLSGTAQGYFSYFGARAAGPNGYYAFDLNGWRIYALNSECDRIDCAAERAWLKADVLANRRTCQLMFMHRPLFSSGGQASDWVKPFWVIGYNNRFELALAGHEHRYERFGPMDPEGRIVTNGIRSFIAGTGGKSLFGNVTPRTGSQIRYNANYGVLFLKLRSASYLWEFRTIGTGALIDSGSAACH